MTLDEELIMIKRRRDFVDKNRDILARYSSLVSDQSRITGGFGVLSPKSAFDFVLQKNSHFYLPICFCFILWELDESEDRKFVLNSLKSLAEPAEDGKIIDATMAYTYAYCLCQSDFDDESFAIIETLGQQCFPPALITLGDGAIAHKNIVYARRYYQHAMQHKYVAVVGRYFRIIARDAPLPKQILVRAYWLIYGLFNMPFIFKKGMEGEHALYLDFYKIKYHLNEYWKIPKRERIKMRKRILAEENA